MSNQGLRQKAARAIYGGSVDVPYNEDFMRLFTFEGVPVAGAFDGRFLQWLNIRLSRTYTNLPEAMTAFAISQGVANWNSVGTFTAAIVGPINTVAPVVSGTTTVGSLLTTTTGTWTGTGTITYAYQWQRAGVNIGGATASTYTLVSGDVASTIRAVVTATDTIGATPANSNSVGPVTWALPVNTVAPVVSGSLTVGSVLTTTNGTWTGSPTITYAYQWKRGVTNVGTNANTYTLVTGDIASNMTCVVTATNGGGSVDATSNSVGPVVAPAAATWNPADKGANITLSGGNLTFTKGGLAGTEYVRATQAKASGSFSVTIVTNDTGSALFPGAGFSDGAGSNGGSLIADNSLLWLRSGLVFVDGTSIGTVAPTFTVADVLTLRLDRALDRVYLSKNGGAETPIDITAIAGAVLYPGAGANLDGAATASFASWV